MHCFHEIKVMVNKFLHVSKRSKFFIQFYMTKSININADSIRAGQKTTHDHESKIINLVICTQ